MLPARMTCTILSLLLAIQTLTDGVLGEVTAKVRQVDLLFKFTLS